MFQFHTTVLVNNFRKMLAMDLTLILAGLFTLISVVNGQGIVKYFNFLCLCNLYIYMYVRMRVYIYYIYSYIYM